MMRSFLACLFLFVACTLGVASIALGQTPPPAPAPTETTIRPGERLRLVCEEDATLNRDLTVTREGLILVSYIGAVPVAGLTPDQAAQAVREELLRQRILPQATLRITRIASEVAPVRFRGALKTAGEIPFTEGLRLAQVIALAEPSPNADLERVEITSSDGKILVIAARANPPLRPGDQVHFPPYTGPREVYVLGGVARPGASAWTEGLTLGQALTAAGGISATGASDRVRLERPGQDPRRLAVPQDIATPLRPLDRIIVELRPAPVIVTLAGEVRRPGSYPLTPNLTLLKLIAAAGGIPEGKSPRHAVIERLGTRSNKPLIIDLDRVRRGLQGDVPLQAGDRVLITDRVPRSSRAQSGIVALR